MAGSGLWPEDVARRLTTDWAGRELHCLDEVDSTNLYLKALGGRGAPQGCTAIAGHQTAGRGRLARRWEAAAGQALLMSVLLRLDGVPAERLPTLVLATALAVSDACRSLGVDVGIKWPNDLVWGGRKLCGMLLELSFGPGGPFAVAGIGVNVAGHPRGEVHAASLEEAAGRAIDRAVLAAAVLNALEVRFDRWRDAGWPALAGEYAARSVTLGREVRVIGAQEEFQARAVGLRDDGALVVERPDGAIEHVQAGDVSVRGTMGYV